MKYFVGIDIGGTDIKYGLVNELGELLEKNKMKTQRQLDLILTDITTIVSQFQLTYPIAGVGISVPGIVRNDGYMVTGGSIFPLYGVQLKETLEERLQLPVSVDNDANCAALAEMWLGAGAGLNSFLSVVVGTGIGGAIVINNRLHRGANATAGEFGFMVSNPVQNGDTRSATLSLTGSVQSGLVNRYYSEDGNRNVTLDGLVIFHRALEGDALAQRLIDDFYDRLSEGLYNLSVAFDPESILIGGAISSNMDFIKELNRRVGLIKDGHPDMAAVKLPPIEPCFFRNDAGMIGAVYKICEEYNYLNVEVQNG